MFASRLRSGEANRLSAALQERRAAGLPIIDLTESNPTRAGFTYPTGLLDGFVQPASLQYDPKAFGSAIARRAVSDDFLRRGLEVPAKRIVLTASTSEAYSVLFKLLCDPGDRVLAPRPSYPLVEHLTLLDCVETEWYSLEFQGRWSMDLDGIARALERPGRTRAIILVSPNNPTGSVVSHEELEQIATLAARHEVAVISDEVFADYPIQNSRCLSAAAQSRALTFSLGGLSKTVGLPQMKLGWIAVTGPERLVDAALDRVETICDAYLSVSTPVQVAVPNLLQSGADVREQIHRRVRENASMLSRVADSYPSCTAFPVEAGWYGVVQIPAVKTEEAFVVELLENTGILVHPGYFFDFERPAFLVFSLLTRPDIIAAALPAVFAATGGA